MSENNAAETDERGRRKTRVGTVVSDKMQKTVVVSVERRFAHPLYGKQLTRTKKYHAHDETDDSHVGDTVRITETRPLSKLKRWRVSEIVERAK
ncbi:30S ribosomal protein S17 [soil metagenome]